MQAVRSALSASTGPDRTGSFFIWHHRVPVTVLSSSTDTLRVSADHFIFPVCPALPDALLFCPVFQPEKKSCQKTDAGKSRKGNGSKERKLLMESVVCSSLAKIYRSGENEVYALNDVSLQLEKGEFTVITGPSGSGKSTLLHLLGAVDRPESGEVMVFGKNITRLNAAQSALYRRRNAGIIYQFFNLIASLNLKQNILLPLSLDGRKPDPEKFEDITETLGLRDRLTHFPSQVSGGQQQRAAIARCLLMEPDLILADEPTGNLDRRNSEEIVDLLKMAARKYGRTVAVVTHDESIAQQADHLIRMEDGKIVLDERRNRV